MATPNNPGWALGFVPTAAQWNNEFASKVDYPAPVAQGGTGGVTAQVAVYNLLQRALIGSTAFSLAALTVYGVNTSVGAFNLFLPLLATLEPGDWIEVADVDFNANVNNITVTAAMSDQIALYNAAAGAQVMNVAGSRARFVVNNSAWRMLV